MGEEALDIKETEDTDPQEEDRAKLTGWTPLEDFKGAPEKWKPAKKWNEFSDNVLPITRADNKRLVEELGATKKEIAQLKKTMKQVITAGETVSVRAYERAKETILKEQRTAIEESDGEKFEALKKQEAELDRSKPQKIATDSLDVGPTYTPEQDDFFSKNSSWYGINHQMTGFAYGVAQEMAQKGASAAAQLKEVERQVKEKFPEQFENLRRGEYTITESTGTPHKKGGKPSFGSLDEASRRMYESLKRDDPKYTKDQYLKDLEKEEQ